MVDPRSPKTLMSLIIAAVGLWAGAAPARTGPAPAPAPAPSNQPTGAPAAAPSSQPSSQAAPGDPFSRLRVVIPRAKLGPVSSIRVRDRTEEADRSREGMISVSIGSRPSGARVLYGGKLLGTTPLSLSAKQGSTPYDIVLQKGGYMTLHTRVRRTTDWDASGKRRKGISYFFTLSPAKIR